jgi:hypothetical protein
MDVDEHVDVDVNGDGDTAVILDPSLLDTPATHAQNQRA